jgi:hypothetical protein
VLDCGVAWVLWTHCAAERRTWSSPRTYCTSHGVAPRLGSQRLARASPDGGGVLAAVPCPQLLDCDKVVYGGVSGVRITRGTLRAVAPSALWRLPALAYRKRTPRAWLRDARPPLGSALIERASRGRHSRCANGSARGQCVPRCDRCRFGSWCGGACSSRPSRGNTTAESAVSRLGGREQRPPPRVP